MRTRLRSLASDSVVYGLSDVISRFLSIFLVPIYTRLFTPADYGVLSLVNASVGVVSTFVVLGLDNSAHRWYWDTEDDDDRSRTIASWTWCQLVISSLFAGIVFFLAPWLSGIILKNEGGAMYFRLAGATLPLVVLGRVASGWMRMQRRPWATTFYALGTNLVTIVATLVLVVGLHWGLKGVYSGQIIAYAVGTVAAALLLRSRILPRHFAMARLREMLRYSFPLIPGALAYWVVGFADRYFVQAYSNTAEVGLYSVGSQIAALVAFATGAFQMAWGPFAFSISKQPDARKTYADAFLIYIWGGATMSAGLSLFAPEAIRLVATTRYLGAADVVGLLALSYVMIGLTYIAATGPSLAKQTRPVGIAMTAAALLNIVLNFAFVPKFGKTGSAVATLISQGLTPAYLFYRSQQIYPIPYRFRTGIAVVTASLSVIIAGTLLQIESTWLEILVKLGLMLIFIPLFFGLGLATPRELAALFSRVMNRARGKQGPIASPPPDVPSVPDTL